MKSLKHGRALRQLAAAARRGDWLGVSVSVPLKGGERVTMRAVRREDAPLMEQFLTDLSDATRHSRFFGGGRVTPDQVLLLTDIDYLRHMALVACVASDRGERQVGDARYVRADDGVSAEFGIVIADAWQGRGLGRLLLEALVVWAGAVGVTEIAGEVLATNTAMLGLARMLGFRIRPVPGAPELRGVSLPLVARRSPR